jgi:CRISPR-associated exonuclease Cas4
MSLAPQAIEDDYQPIRALNDLLYCERRCALHRIENVWVDNAHTVSGTFSHQRADRPVDWKCGSGREVHAMWLKSDRLHLVGKADVVEFHPQADGPDVPFPVEYKRGKRRKWDNDDTQLCAQALCLEEMLGTAVPRGAIFHIKTKRRREVVFTPTLRSETEATARRLHELISSGITPPPVPKPQCKGCSLLEICMPKALERTKTVNDYMRSLWKIIPESSISGN